MESDAQTLEGRAPADILAWAVEHLAPVTFTPGFGPEGCVIIDLIARNRLPVNLSTLDTGLLFPETLALWRQLEGRYGITIRAVRPAQTVAEQAREFGDRLCERDPDRCCDLRKAAPLRAALPASRARSCAIPRAHPPERPPA